MKIFCVYFLEDGNTSSINIYAKNWTEAKDQLKQTQFCYEIWGHDDNGEYRNW